MINYKIIEVYNISICCEVIFEMRTADSEKVSFYDCAENVKMKMADVISTLSIFVIERIENELIFECSWE